jgi:hypothetical protein
VTDDFRANGAERTLFVVAGRTGRVDSVEKTGGAATAIVPESLAMKRANWITADIPDNMTDLVQEFVPNKTPGEAVIGTTCIEWAPCPEQQVSSYNTIGN